MNWLLHVVLSLLVGGVGVYVAAAVVPNFTIRGGFRSAIYIGAVYGFLKFLLGDLLLILSVPLVLATLGVFLVVINAFLLWMTDKISARLRISTLGSLLAATVLLSAIDLSFRMVTRIGAPY